MKRTDYRIRPAEKADLDAFYGLFAQVQGIHADAEPEFFRPPVNDEAFRQYFEGILSDPHQHLLFACRDGAVVGLVHFFLGMRPENVFQPERRVGYIHGLVVDRANRRSGCGALLVEQVKRAARREGATLLGIDFWSFNEAARAGFESSGFQVSRAFMWQRL